MGNPLLKQYHVDQEPAIPGTRHGRWTIHRGRHVDRPGGDVSLFTCNLRAPEFAGLSPEGSVLQQLRSLLHQDAQLLQRLRHPRLLQVVDPLQQGKDSWVFCTKPVVLSLRQLLGTRGGPQRHMHQPEQGAASLYNSGGLTESSGSTVTSLSSSSTSSSSKQQTQKAAKDAEAAAALWRAPLSLLEVKCGLVDVAEALSFLHKSAQLLHLNIHPESVFVDSEGRWKVGGLFFAQQIQARNDAVDCSFSFGGVSAGVALVPPLRYSAPELCSGYPVRASAAADVFSFSLLAAECLGASGLLTCRDGDVEAHQQQCSGLSALRGSAFAADSLFQQGATASPAAGAAGAALLQLLSRGLSLSPAERPSIEEFLSDQFLLSTETRALRFLSCLHEKEQQQQQQFLAGLLPLLQQQKQLWQPRLLRIHVLEPLLSALKYPSLFPVLLPNIFCALKKLSDPDYFWESAWPRLQPLLTAKEIQVEAVVCLVEEFEFLVKSSTEQMRTNDLLPFLLKCLDIQAGEIQRAALVALHTCLGAFDYTSQRSLLLPRVLSLVSNAETSGVRLAGLEGLAAMATAFDRVAIEAQILPVIQQASKADRSPRICTAISSTLSCLSRSLALTTTAEKGPLPRESFYLAESVPWFGLDVAPYIMSITETGLDLCTVEDGLSVEEYRRIDAEVKLILRKVDEDRQRHFTLKAEQQSAVQAALPACCAAGPTLQPPPPPSVPAVSFEAFLSDSFTATAATVQANTPTQHPQKLPAPPRPPPPPITAAAAHNNNASDYRDLQQRHRHEQNDVEDLLASLSARLPRQTSAAPPLAARAAISSRNTNIQPSLSSQGENADLDSILAAASAAVHQANASSFDPFADLIKPPPAVAQPIGAQLGVNRLAALADKAATGPGGFAQAGDPFAERGTIGLSKNSDSAVGLRASTQGTDVTSLSTSNSRGCFSPASDPFAGLGVLMGSKKEADGHSSDKRCSYDKGATVLSNSSLRAETTKPPGMFSGAPAGDPFAGIEALAEATPTADPFANLGVLSAVSTGYPKSKP